MIKQPPAFWRGIYAATITPLSAEGEVDESSLERHVAAVTHGTGIRGVLCNGHAGENFLLRREEKRRVIEVTRRVAGPDAVIVSGINAEDSDEAASHAADACAAGADALLVFPPFSWALSNSVEMIARHHRIIDAAAQAPLMLYQAGVTAGRLPYPPEVLTALLDLPRVIGIKEGSWETAAYEANRRLVKSLRPEVAVMASGDEHLLPCFVLGSDGSQVSLAAIIPETIVALDRAVAAGDLELSRRLHETISPLARTIYGTAPGGYATARIKHALWLLGRIPEARARAPIGRLPDAEVDRLRTVLAHVGLL